MEQITLLEQKELVKLDSGRLEELYMQLGDAGAEDVVCRALEEVAARLSHTERCYREERGTDLRKTARGLIAIADQVGMNAVAQVARDVTFCIDEHDRVALAATLSRLLRVGERSLEEIWELRDYSV